ncbi:MAG TPA: hypothetical protein VG432_01485 [Gemmatimonadaceae bacterium]|nr:hypothetical protein [Gemmatimonadaceae bacterium]
MTALSDRASFLVAALLAAAPMAAQDAHPDQVSLRIPDSVGVFAMAARKDFDDPGLGVMLRYQRADSLRIDVFVYPGPDLATDCALSCAREVLDKDVHTFAEAFPEMVKRHYVDSIAVVRDDTLSRAADDPWQLGRHVTLRIWQGGTAERSDFYLYYLPSVRVKLRATYVADSMRVAAVTTFAHDIVPALVARAQVAAAASPDSRHIGVTVTLPGPPSAIFAKLLDALTKQGYTIADSSRETGRITTAPTLSWPKGSEKEAWHGSDSPGVLLVVRMQTKGDSTTVSISGQSPTVAGWKDAKVANQLELISVVMLAGELPDPHPR